jgi:hypothetical protein
VETPNTTKVYVEMALALGDEGVKTAGYLLQPAAIPSNKRATTPIPNLRIVMVHSPEQTVAKLFFGNANAL